MAATKTKPGTRKTTKGSSGFRPLGDKLLVRRDEAETMTDAGLYLPEAAKDKPKTGVVEAVGSGAVNRDTGELIPMTLSKGDRVLFGSYSGTEIKLGGVEMLIMSEDEVLAVIND